MQVISALLLAVFVSHVAAIEMRPGSPAGGPYKRRGSKFSPERGPRNGRTPMAAGNGGGARRRIADSHPVGGTYSGIEALLTEHSTQMKPLVDLLMKQAAGIHNEALKAEVMRLVAQLMGHTTTAEQILSEHFPKA